MNLIFTFVKDDELNFIFDILNSQDSLFKIMWVLCLVKEGFLHREFSWRLWGCGISTACRESPWWLKSGRCIFISPDCWDQRLIHHQCSSRYAALSVFSPLWPYDELPYVEPINEHNVLPALGATWESCQRSRRINCKRKEAGMKREDFFSFVQSTYAALQCMFQTNVAQKINTSFIH